MRLKNIACDTTISFAENKKHIQELAYVPKFNENQKKGITTHVLFELEFVNR